MALMLPSYALAQCGANGQLVINPLTNQPDCTGATTVNATTINSIRIASSFAGSDCGAKINAAVTNLGGSPGEIWVNQACGTTWTTAVTIPAKVVLRFIQGGTYTISALITNGGHITGDTAGVGWETTGTGTTIIKQANGTNLATMILLNTEAASVEGGLEIDGNKANNGTAQDCIDVTDARGILLENLFIHDCKRHGGYINSTSANLSAVPVVRHVVGYNNGTDGLRVQNTTDLVVGVFSEFEANGGNGIRLIDSPAARIEHSDVAGNALPGLFVTGTVGGQHSHLTQIVGNQFGNNVQEDIYLDGTATGTYVTEGNVITGNVFYGGTNRSNLTFPAIRVKDTAQNTIGPNVFNDTAAHVYTYGIQEDNTLGKIGSNSYVGNNFFFAGGETGTIGSLAASLSFYCVDGNGLCAAAQLGVFYNAGVAGSGQIFLGGYPGAANVAQWTFNPGVTVSTVTGNLFGVAYSGNAFVETDDVNGNKGILGRVVPATYGSASNCSSSASPAVCGSAAAGSVTVAAGATTKVVNTTAVTANSQIFLTNDSSLGTKLSVTCNTQSSLTLGTPRVTARTAATSFTITIEAGPTTNPMCISYFIVN